MKKSAVFLSILVVVFAAHVAQVGDISGLRQKMIEARRTLYVLLDDVKQRGAEQQQRVKDTANAVSAMLGGMKAPAGKEAKFKELAATWQAFKKTREEELVPAILSGKQKEAEKIATGVQNERFRKMMSLCDELEER